MNFYAGERKEGGCAFKTHWGTCGHDYWIDGDASNGNPPGPYHHLAHEGRVGTRCAPCPCTGPCVHMLNLVCEEHQAWLDGYIEAVYNLWELTDPENYEPEEFEPMFNVLEQHLMLTTEDNWGANLQERMEAYIATQR